MTRRRRWLRRLLVAAPTLGAVYALLGFLVVPWVAHTWVVPKLGESIRGELRVQTIRCNPFTLSLTLGGVEVDDEAGERVLALGHLYANLQASSLVREGFVLRRIVLREPFARLVLEADGSLNLAQLLEPSDEPPSDEPWSLPRVRGQGLLVEGGRIEFLDKMLEDGRLRTLTPLSLAFGAFDTAPSYDNVHRFVANSTAGERLAWEGEIQLDPLTMAGRLELSDVDLSLYTRYAQRLVPSLGLGGRLSVQAGYDFAPAASPPRAGVTLERASLAGLRVALGPETVLSADRLGVEGVSADAAARSLRVARAAAEGPGVFLWRDGEGRLPWLDAELVIAQAAAADARAVEDAGARFDAEARANLTRGLPEPWDEVVLATVDLAMAAAEPWSVSVEAVAVREGSARWRDASTPMPAEVEVRGVRLDAGPIRSDEGFVTPWSAELAFAGGGEAQASGSVTPLDPSASLRFELRGLALAPASPYLAQLMPGKALAGGRLSVRGDAAGSLADAGDPALTFTGGVELAEFEVRDEAGDQAWAGVAMLGLEGIALDHRGRRVRVERVVSAEPRGTLELALIPPAEGDGGAEPSDPAADPAARPAAPASFELPLGYRVAVGAVEIDGAGLRVVDRSGEEAFELPVREVRVRATDLDTGGDTPGELSVEGRVGTAAMTLAGTVLPNPRSPALDLAFELRSLRMPALSPLSARFVGYGLEGGELEQGVDLRLTDWQLDAATDLRIARFELGGQAEAKPVVNVPVKTAVFILRDPSGTIDLPTIRIRGDVSDPSFELGPVILQAFVGVMTRITTAPLRFLAGALSVPEDVNLEYAAMPPGGVELDAEARRTLDALASVLRERPGVALAVRGHAAEADEPALRRAALVERIRAATAATLDADDPRRVDPSSIEVSDAAYRQAVRNAYRAMTEPTDGGAAEGAAPAESAIPEAALRVDPAGAAEGEPEPRRPARRFRGGRSSVGGAASPAPSRAAPEAPALPEAPSGDAAGSPPEAEASSAGGLPEVPFAEAESAVLAGVDLEAGALGALASRRAEAARAYLLEGVGLPGERVVLAELAAGSAEASPGVPADFAGVSFEVVVP